MFKFTIVLSMGTFLFGWPGMIIFVIGRCSVRALMWLWHGRNKWEWLHIDYDHLKRGGFVYYGDNGSELYFDWISFQCRVKVVKSKYLRLMSGGIVPAQIWITVESDGGDKRCISISLPLVSANRLKKYFLPRRVHVRERAHT